MENYELGNRIYELRKEKNLSQKELGDILGVSNKAVSKWETGAAAPKTATIMKLSSVLGVSTEELLTGKTDEPESLEGLSQRTKARLMKEKNEAFEKDDLDKRYRFAKTYLITLCIIVAISFIIAFLLGYFTWLYGDISARYIDVTNESASITEILIGSLLFAFLAASIFTGFCVIVKFLKSKPSGWSVAFAALFFIVWLVIGIVGACMLIPTALNSIKDVKAYRRAKNE